MHEYIMTEFAKLPGSAVPGDSGDPNKSGAAVFETTSNCTSHGRRSLLRMLSALGVAFLVPSDSGAVDAPEPLSLSVADSLLQYQLLLDQAESDAISNAGRHVAIALSECSALLSELEQKLIALQAKLNNHNIHWDIPPDKKEIIEQSIALASDQGTTIPSLQLVRSTFFGSTLTSLLVEIGENCQLDPDSSIRSLIASILSQITKHNDAIQIAAKNQLEWNSQIVVIRSQVADIRRDLFQAAGKLTAVLTEQVDPSTVEVTQKLINKAVVSLSSLESSTSHSTGRQPSAQTTLVQLLRAASSSLKTALAVSLPLRTGLGLVMGIPRIVLDKNSLIGRVVQIVRKPGYFLPSPGSQFQVVQCVAICLPIWANYPNDAQQQTREDLIKSTLELEIFLSVNRDEQMLPKIAKELASACSANAQKVMLNG